MFRKFRQKRKARKHLSELFSRPDLREISSLRPEHKSRAMFLDFKAEGNEIQTIRFGLIRHPQAANVKGVFNEVIEIYLYNVKKETVEVINSCNITKKGKAF